MMSDNLDLTIKQFRQRASHQKLISLFAVIGVVGVVVFGLYIFIFVSPKIAALDIEEQRKARSGGGDAVSSLAALNIGIRKNEEKIDSIKSRMPLSEDFVRNDGNYRIKDDLKGYNNNKFEHHNPNITALSIDELKALISNIEGYTSYLRTPFSLESYLSSQPEKLRSLMEELERHVQEKARTEKEYNHLKSTLPPELSNSALERVAGKLGDYIIEINRIEQKVESEKQKADSGYNEKNTSKKIKSMIQKNDAAVVVVVLVQMEP